MGREIMIWLAIEKGLEQKDKSDNNNEVGYIIIVVL